MLFNKTSDYVSNIGKFVECIYKMLQAESNITEAFNLVKVINTHEEQDILQLIPLIKKPTNQSLRFKLD